MGNAARLIHQRRESDGVAVANLEPLRRLVNRNNFISCGEYGHPWFRKNRNR